MDPCQVPPVNSDDCIPFKSLLRDEYGIHCIRLTEIMRQAKGNPIIDLSFSIRNHISQRFLDMNQFKTIETAPNIGTHICYANKKEDKIFLVNRIIELFDCKQFEDDANYAKVLAWRNDTVNTYNQNIRKKIFKYESLPKIIKGEKLIANSPVIVPTNHGFNDILFNTNDEFNVHDVELGEYKDFKCYNLKVKSDNFQRLKEIRVLHEEHEPKMRNLLRKVAEEAKTIQKIDIAKSQFKWKTYYNIKNYFADVNYNYALTTHKAQGSTYQNTIVLMNDIMTSYKTIERNRILYTAVTRPKQQLIILT